MDQRRVRLGDIVDDYCPRERRLTNHAVVAMIEDEIRQTRCTTCDAEHPYKSGKIPRRRKKSEDETDAPAAAMPAGQGGDESASESDVDPAFDGRLAAGLDDASGPDEGHAELEPKSAAAAPEGAAAPDSVEDGPVRRPLIRATLPRPEGQPTARPLPEFTVRQPGVRGGGGGRHGDFRGPRDSRQSANGNRPGGGGGQARHGRSGSGHGRPSGGSHRGASRQEHQGGHGRSGGSTPHGRGGKKRSR